MEGKGEQFIESIVERLTGKESQFDLRLRHVVLEVRGTPLALELNGTVTVSAHMRELTDSEKQALASHRVASVRD